MVEEQQVDVARVELVQLVLDIRHGQGGCHGRDCGRVRAAAAAWDARRHEDVGTTLSRDLWREVLAIAVAVNNENQAVGGDGKVSCMCAQRRAGA